MKTLSVLNDADIRDAFITKLWAYTAVSTPHGAGLGVAAANVPGYMPVPLSFYCVPRWDVAEAEAVRLNVLRGMDQAAADAIIMSSVAAGRVSA